MTQHDQISSFIDNELSGEQEQDFLISLASSDGLRKSFRSELVLKNVIHQDEVLTSPSRDMRGAVLMTLGIAGTTALAGSAETANAATIASATKATIVKTLFASKLNILFTASMITASALGGYAVRTYTAEAPTQTVGATARHFTPSIHEQNNPLPVATEVMKNTSTEVSQVSAPKKNVSALKTKHIDMPNVEPPSATTPGIGGVGMAKPETTPPSK